jgi:two-component system response regulator GlrR
VTGVYAQGRVLIINGRSGGECDQFARQLKQLGYATEHVGFDALDRRVNAPIILFVDKPVSRANLKSLRSAEGLVNILATYSHLIEEQPELSESAAEYCLLPCQASEVDIRLRRSIFMLGQRPATAEADNLLQQNIIGRSAAFVAAMALLRRYATADAPVIIQGETGTGKELAARALHYSSGRRSMPFQALNCGALPEHLVENELFGHARGAYTDARAQQLGLVALAEGGTLFLDEIDSLPLKAQTALLRFLQNGEYRPLGSSVWKKANVRVISATNRNIDDLVAAGHFRQDLIFRLNTLPLELPALRARPDDIVLLATHFLKKCALEYKSGEKVLHASVQKKMRQYTWPGNVRELENYVVRAYLLADTQLITLEPGEKIPCVHRSPEVSEIHSGVLPDFGQAKKAAIDQFEREYVLTLLRQTGGNVSRAAQIAGKERRVFGRLLKKHQIDRRNFIVAT